MSGLAAVERPATGPARGLLVLLHGVGANEHSLGALALEQAADVAVVLPRGPLAFGPGQYGWFQVRFTPQGPVIDPQQAEASRRALIDFVAAQQQAHGVAPARTLIAGFSQGGILSASVALTAPALVAGFGVLSGRILPEVEAHIPAGVGAHGLHGLILHGRHDGKLGHHFAERAQQRLQHYGVAHTLKSYDADHELTAPMRADFRAWVEERLAVPAVA